MIYYGDKDSRDYLAHYGVVGMKWGIRRYQPYSYTGARKGGKTGKEIGIAGKLGNGIKSTAKKVKKFVDKTSKEHAEKSAERKEQRAAKKEERWLKKKDKILKSGSTAQVLKISNKLSDQEISGAANRIRNEMTLRDLQDQESRRSIERGTKAIRSMVDFGQTVYSGYKLVNEVHDEMEKRAKKAKDKAHERELEEVLGSHDAEKISNAFGKEIRSVDDAQKASKYMSSYKLISGMITKPESTGTAKTDNTDSAPTRVIESSSADSSSSDISFESEHRDRSSDIDKQVVEAARRRKLVEERKEFTKGQSEGDVSSFENEISNRYKLGGSSDSTIDYYRQLREKQKKGPTYEDLMAKVKNKPQDHNRSDSTATKKKKKK